MTKTIVVPSHDDDSSLTTTTTTTTRTHFDFFNKFKSFNPLEPSLGIASFFLLTLLLFLGCFLYVDYRGLRFWGSNLLGLSVSSFPSAAVSSPPRVQVVDFLDSGGDGCDVFDGNWVWDDTYPLYNSVNCSFLDLGFRCSENGRPDSFYTKWRWQPKGCNLPRFDAGRMLDSLRNKRLVFVGDSIGRNQWESLLCMLSSNITNKSAVYEVNGNPITKHSGFLVFKFEDFNCTVEYYRSTFLVVQGHPPPGAPENVRLTLRLDVMDWTSHRWRDADVLVFNTGHWWNYEKTIKMGCYFQIGSEVQMNMTLKDAFRKSVETMIDWIAREVNMNKTYVSFRTYSPVHFRGGDWNTGGGCNLETLPDLGSMPAFSDSRSDTVFEVLSERANTSGAVNLDMLNVTQMSLRRKDGHASIYHVGPDRRAPLQLQDCSHWCLPGVPDSWNEILYAVILKKEAFWERYTRIVSQVEL